LLAALLSLPLPANYPALTLTPQLQRQKTLETLLTWLYAEAKRQPVLVIVEDLHWIDPSTLELLSLLIDQMASTRLCLMLTARPEFRSPWTMVAHLTALTLRRFAPAQVTRLGSQVAGDKTLPPAVLEEVVRKTDGVPLFVEELTKVVLESGLLQEQEDRYDLTGPLPPLAMQGQGEAGLAQMHQGLAAVLATGNEAARPRYLILLAELSGPAGQVEEGLRLVAEALRAFEAGGQGDMLAEAYRLQGALLLRQSTPDPTQAETCFQQALTIARRQQAKSWELRAATSLARLWQRQGKRAEAHALLAPIYGWFIEGFDTADLQEASVLLAELM
jgi:tetratricopeptide (TPR) repeat protein